ncbi:MULTISPECIES: M20/M25/M40 family metallo-hydrolase [Sphingomonas]|uniref:M20/M25/M40 family metallo-hydrolase n=1 Tax=Sphingomonas TaxID=13687 RepID=UPI0006F919D1|nr:MULTISPECIES: M20/M25/M40 family metallo-hydrolase [Sphingomonas]KQM92638.1 peptidase M20 [Sphingomonas sp. Leaf226]MDY0967738.1 M20/M25/M40 family metallo-hydrolase [Sphingomonas sp. CFBP9021]USR00775.1 M20/M25/M40 family metallo-hydrolase [Sphingomonas aerolata]
MARQKFRWVATVVGVILLAGAAQARLTPAEMRAVATVDAEHERSIALLKTLVDQNSGTMNLAGVAKVGVMVRAELEPLGFAVTWKPMPQTQRAGHLIARHPGKPGAKRLLLIGHLDTVFEQDSPFQRFEREGERATGPGAGDDKGGIVVMLSALRAMKAAGLLDAADIEIVLTGDEEDAGDPVAIARGDLIAAGKRANVALDFEGLSVVEGRDMGSIARRSSNGWVLTTSGKTGHSSLIFSDAYGDGAINEMARILAVFRKDLPEPNLTFNTGVVAGGATATLDSDGVRASATGKGNIIPATAVARGDFRTLSEDQTMRVRAKMERIVAAHAPGTNATIRFESGYPAMPPTVGNRALLDRLNLVNRDMGLPEMAALDPLKRGAGDIAFVAGDVDGLIGLGTASSGDHAPGETVDLASIRRQAKRAAILMARLSREPKDR